MATAPTGAAVGSTEGTSDTTLSSPGDSDMFPDHDSFEDDYAMVDDDGEDDSLEAGRQITSPTQAQEQAQQDQSDTGNDEYSKTFDSPVDVERDGIDIPLKDLQDVSSETPLQSIHTPASSLSLTPSPSAAPVASTLASASPHQSAVTPRSEQPQTAADPTPSNSHNFLPSRQPTSHNASASDTASPALLESEVNQAIVRPPLVDATADIQRLVADLAAQTSVHQDMHAPLGQPSPLLPQRADAPAVAPPVPTPTSLPPRPPLPELTASSNGFPEHIRPVPSSAATPTPSPTNMAPHHVMAPVISLLPQLPTYPTPGLRVPASDAQTSLPPPPSAALSSNAGPIPSMAASPLYHHPNSFQYPGAEARPHPQSVTTTIDSQRAYDAFVAEERRFMSEAKWDRFPDGSRIFIGSPSSAVGGSRRSAHVFTTGNLSSEKVSKRDIFDLFHQYGRLAQISLKSAYGFVQYHTVDDAQRAMDHLQGVEIKGRNIRACSLFVLSFYFLFSDLILLK